MLTRGFAALVLALALAAPAAAEVGPERAGVVGVADELRSPTVPGDASVFVLVGVVVERIVHAPVLEVPDLPRVELRVVLAGGVERVVWCAGFSLVPECFRVELGRAYTIRGVIAGDGGAVPAGAHALVFAAPVPD